MKKLMNKNFIQKIVIAILIVLSFNFVVPNFSCAVTADEIGGLLWTPVRMLVTGIGDTILYWLNFFFVGFTYDEAQQYLEAPLKPANLNAVAKFDSDTEGFINQKGGKLEVQIDRSDDMGIKKEIPIIEYGPDMIFANEVPGLDANYINPTKETKAGFSITEDVSITRTLQEAIATWYVSLRNLVIVCLLSILLYVAIRIIISSTASDKAKYKKMLMDWLISFCLVFFMHYIMAFTMELLDIITKGLANSSSNITVILGSDKYYFNTNIMGYCRFMTQSDSGIETMGFTMLYIALVVYTLKFTWEYMKRSIKMAFLTLMAPLVTLTYAIDKMGDGKAQAFNAWLKEYVFTALIQPFHLLIYSIFMGASMNIAARNPLYAVLFLAFLTPAEKLLRKFFGFDKEASGGSSFAGGFGGAAAFNMLKGAVSKGAQGLQLAKGASGQNSNIRQKTNMVKDPNAPKGDLSSFKTGAGNNPEIDTQDGNNISEGNNKNEALTASNSRPTKDEALEKYSAEGFGKNANGEYFNPYTDEYDPDYDPHNDSSYNVPQRDEVLEKYSAEGFGKNADGEYYNPYTDEYDSNYDPHNDSSYNVPQNNEIPKSNANENVAQMEASQPDRSEPEIENSAPTPQRFTSQQSVRSLANNSASRPKSSKQKGAKANIAKGIGRVALRGAIGTAKIAGKLAAGTVMGAIGLGMGIAGDDMEDVFKYAAGGFALGYTAVPAIAKNTIDDVKGIGSSVRSEFELGAYGTTEAAMRQQERDTKHDKALRTEQIERLTEENGGRKPTRQEINERMQQVADYRNAGVTDSSTMYKAMKVEKEINEQLQNSGMSANESGTLSRNQAIEIAKLAEPYSKQELRNEDKVNDLRTDIMGKLTKGSNGLTKKEAERTCENIIKNVKKIKGV